MLALWLSLVACSTPGELDQLADKQLLERFRELHTRIYRVYALKAERDAVHDLLASTFAGEALTREYIEHFTTLVRMQREHTAIQIVRVDYESVEMLGRDGSVARLQADWSVGGVVTHQRHKHPRVNRYQAVFELALPDLIGASDGPVERLRIVDTRLRNLERVGSLSGAGGFSFDALPQSERGFMTAEELLRSGLLDELFELEAGEATTPPE